MKDRHYESMMSFKGFYRQNVEMWAVQGGLIWDEERRYSPIQEGMIHLIDFRCILVRC